MLGVQVFLTLALQLRGQEPTVAQVQQPGEQGRPGTVGSQ